MMKQLGMIVGLVVVLLMTACSFSVAHKYR